MLLRRNINLSQKLWQTILRQFSLNQLDGQHAPMRAPFFFPFGLGGMGGGSVEFPFLWILVFSAMFLTRPHFHSKLNLQNLSRWAKVEHFYTYILRTIAQCFCVGPIKVAPWKGGKEKLWLEAQLHLHPSSMNTP
jgi:hypothetical protein